MSKIATYSLADSPLQLSDRLIGTEAPRPIPSPTPLATKNFSLGELLQLFSSEFPASTLQAVLDAGNIATQDINLTGTIYVDLIKPTNIEDMLGSQGEPFQVLSKAIGGFNWVDPPSSITLTTDGDSGPATLVSGVLNIPIYAGGNTPNLQQVTDEGNITTNELISADGLYRTKVTPAEVVVENGSDVDVCALQFDGLVRLYDTGSGLFSQTLQFENPSIDGVIIIPNATGTLALTSDITTPTLQQVTNEGNTTTNSISIVSANPSDFTIVSLNSISTSNSVSTASISPSVIGINEVGFNIASAMGSRSFTLQNIALNNVTSLYMNSLEFIENGVGKYLRIGDTSLGQAIYNLPNKDYNTGIPYVLATLDDIPTSSGIPHATAAGTDTYTATITGVTSYADGDAYLIRFPNGNTTGATLNINSLGARPLYRNNDGPLIGGDILSGAEMLCVYNSSLNIFQAIGTAPNTLLGYVTNADSVTITKGQVVYAFGGQGDRMTVKLANNTSDATSARTVGVVLSTSIAANQKGIIIMQGLLDGLNILPTATYSDGDPIYLGATNGSITKVKPYAPNHLVYVGTVTTASNGSAGRMYIKIQNGYELDELHNVQAQSPSLKDTLWYDNTVSPAQWKTASISTILGYTPGTVSSVAALTLGTSGTDLSSTVANGTTTPVITLDVPTASASNRGVLSPTDWSTFNNKQNNLRTFNTTEGIYYFEEFLGQSRNVDFGIGNGQGSSAYTATITNRTNQQGVVQHNTNANSVGQAGFTFVNGAFQFIGGGVITLEEYINITTLSTLAERFYTFFGYVVGSNFAAATNSITISYDEGGVYLNPIASPNFKCITRAGGLQTTSVTSVPVTAGQWYKLRIVINANASSVEFYIDNVLVATHNTNIPATTTAMYIANGIVKTTGTTARSMQTDYFMYEQIFTNPR